MNMVLYKSRVQGAADSIDQIHRGRKRYVLWHALFFTIATGAADTGIELMFCRLEIRSLLALRYANRFCGLRKTHRAALIRSSVTDDQTFTSSATRFVAKGDHLWKVVASIDMH